MDKEYLRIIYRYSILLIVLFLGVSLSYFLFLEPTLYSSYYLIKLFYPSASILGTDILIGGKVISIIGSCVAGSAYLLLFILNLSVPNIKPKKRIYILLSSFFIFFILNVARILYLGILYLRDSPSFDSAHKVLWYFGSTAAIILIWFLEVRIFKIKEIPFYSDIKKLYKLIN